MSRDIIQLVMNVFARVRYFNLSNRRCNELFLSVLLCFIKNSMRMDCSYISSYFFHNDCLLSQSAEIYDYYSHKLTDYQSKKCFLGVNKFYFRIVISMNFSPTKI